MAKRKDYTLADLARMFKTYEIVIPMPDRHVLISSNYLQIHVPRSSLPIQYDANKRRASDGRPWDNDVKDSVKAAMTLWKSIKIGARLDPVTFSRNPVSIRTFDSLCRVYKTEAGPMMANEQYMAFVEKGTGAHEWHMNGANDHMLVAVNSEKNPVGLVMCMRIDGDGALELAALDGMDPAGDSNE